MFLAGHGSYLGSLSIFNERHEEFYYHGKEYNHFLYKKISLVSNCCLALRGNSAVFSCHFRRHMARTRSTSYCLSYQEFPINNRFVFIMCVLE